MTRKRRWLLLNIAVVLLTTVPLFFVLRGTLKTNRERALVAAVQAGQTEKVRSLLDRGTSMDLHDADGDTLLRAAIRNNHRETVALLEERKSPTDPETNLLLSCLLGRTEKVRELLKSGVNPNAKDLDNDNALSYAAPWGHEEIVKLLIAHKTDVNNLNNRGLRPIHWANDCTDKPKRDRILALLIKAGAKKVRRSVFYGK